MTTDDGMDVVVTETPSATIARQAAEIERLRAELDDQRKDTRCDEQRVADLMADVQRQGKEIERLRGLLALAGKSSLDFQKFAEAEFTRLRGLLREWLEGGEEGEDTFEQRVREALGE